MISRFSSKRRAVTLTELLVVLAIISLLATIAVPVYLQKTEQARLAVARQEVRAIADAEQQVFALYGFLVPIHVLDNLPDLPSGTATTSASRDDFAHDTNLGTKYVIDPLGDLQDQITNPVTLSQLSQTNNSRVRRLVDNWAGPFLNAQRVQMGNRDQAAMNSTSQEVVSNALVNDPWGRPYRLYSPIGVTGTGSVTSVATLNQSDLLYDRVYDNGFLTRTDPRFDRWAVCSFGRDGVSDEATGKYNNTGTNANVLDDVFYTFGIVVGESFYRAF